MNNKKIIIIIIISIIIFILSATLVFFLAKRSVSKVVADNLNSAVIQELKNNNPGLNNSQLGFYADAAAKGSISACLGRDDQNVCVSSVAFLKGDSNICHDLDFADEKLYEECIRAVIKQTGKEDIGKCDAFSGDKYFNCLWAVFSIYSKTSDCENLTDLDVRTVCEDFFNYQTVYTSYNRELCKTIKNEKLNQYCLKKIINKK